MAGELQPLDQQFQIVDATGRPTLYFIQWAQQRQIDIGTAITLDVLQQYLEDHHLSNAQEILDQISTTWGSILFRGSAGWQALAPGAAGSFLKTNGAGADPSWAAGGAGLPTLTTGTDVDLVIDPGAGGTVMTTINLAASAAVRTYLVNSFISFTGHGIDAVIRLDAVAKHNTLRYVDGGDRTTWIHCGPVVLTIPGDNAAHTIDMFSADVGSLGAVTITDRWMSAQQLT